MTLGHTITGTYATGVTLTSTVNSNPFTVTTTARASANTTINLSSALYGQGSVAGTNTWTVTNYGTIIGGGTNAHNAIKLGADGKYIANGVVLNKAGGLITATNGYGVLAYGPLSVTNSAGATIVGGTDGMFSFGGTLVNNGVILAGNVGDYVSGSGVGVVTNTGRITGAEGIWLQGVGTVTNSGTIIGTASQGSVYFQSSTGSSRLIIDPGAVFSGEIHGFTTASDVIELASSASAGTLTGFNGITITNFATLQFDAGSKWTVIGASTKPGTTAAVGIGTASITGFTINDTIDLTGFAAVSETFASNALVLSNATSAHTTLHIQGSFSSSNFTLASYGGTGTGITFGTGTSALVYGQTTDETGIIATSETVAAGTMTLFNSGTTAVGTIVAGTSLSTGEFTLKTDGSTGTDVIVNSVFGTYASGVTLLSNPTTIVSTAHVSNTVTNGKAVYGPTGTSWTLTNQATITASGSNGIDVKLKAGGTVTNSGLISGISTAAGIYIGGTGGVTNLSSGTITSGTRYGIRITGIGNVTNSGTIQTGATDITGNQLMTVVNTGVILGTSGGSDGINLVNGGSITNSALGTIIAGQYGIAIDAVAGTVSNSGTIEGTGGHGVYLYSGTVVNSGLITGAGGLSAVYFYGASSLINQAGGTITGGVGVTFSDSASDTVSNAGTITGNTGYAILFTAGSNRMIDVPGGVINGTVVAGGGIAVVELASAASAGTISGFGGLVKNFTSLVFDSGAAWTVAGNDSAAGLGTLGISGFGVADTIDLTGFAAVSRTFASNSLVLTNGTGGHATLAIQSTLATANFIITGDGTGGTDIVERPLLVYGQTIDETGIVATTETVSAGVMTLTNGGGTVVGTIAVGTSLSTGDFALAPDGSGGTGVIVTSVFGTYTSGVTLLTRPATIASTAKITGSLSGAIGVTGPGGTSWTLVNKGSISETGTSGQGISFAAAGTITNAGGGIVHGAQTGIALAAGGVLTNQSGGTITGYNGVYVTVAAAAVLNTGSIGGNTTGGSGIRLAAGGQLTNQSGGTITGELGVYGNGAAVNVVNTGSIGGNDTVSSGIVLEQGGSVTNQSGGTITGYDGILVATDPITVVNSGAIGGNLTVPSGAGVNLFAGGSVTNISGGTISGYSGVNASGAPATVVNAGVIAGNVTANNGAGVVLSAGGSVTNQSSGTISAYNAIRILGAAGNVANLGLINATYENFDGTNGVYLQDGGAITNGASGGTASAAAILGYNGAVRFGASGAGTLTNFGTLTGDPGHPGVIMTTGTVINGPSGATGALIEGGEGSSVVLISGAGTVVNYATIVSVAPSAFNNGILYGISLGGAGTISNLGSHSLIETYIPIYAARNATVVNAGTIESLYNATIGAHAIVFGGGTNRLIVDPGARFYGTVSGSGPVTVSSSLTNTIIGTANSVGTSTLELASTTATGTISGIGVGYVGFGQITVDSGASWVLAGTNTLTSGITLTNSGTDTVSGTLVNAGVVTGTTLGIVLGVGGQVSNQAGGLIAATASSGIAVSAGGAGTLVNAGSIQADGGSGSGVLAAAGSVTNLSGGTISGASAVYGHSGALTLVNAGRITGVNFGARLHQGGTVTNLSGGTISGTTGAVTFSAGFTNRLVVYRGAVFTGTVTGGNTIGATSISTLELASSASAGTFGGIGTQFIDFAQVTVDAGAQWTLSGSQIGFKTLTNAGSLGGISAYGIKVGAGATGVTLVNLLGGVIYGSDDAVFVVSGSGTGTVSNSGQITGGTTGFAAIALWGGGGVTNASGGTITGLGVGVFIDNGAGAAVSNAGSIGASQSYGIWLLVGGTVTNAFAGIITGGYAAASAAGVYLADGGAVTNQSGGTIGGLRGVYVLSSAGTVVNAGHIVGSGTNIGDGAAYTGAGVYLTAGGSVTNQSGGTITGYFGVYARNVAATVVNAGVIAGNYTSDAVHADGVYLADGGTITNQAGGTIYGGNDGVLVTGARGTVINRGSIHSHIGGYGGRGVSLGAGGLIVNGTAGGTASTAVIAGYNYAVQFGETGTDTLVNYGTIDGHPGTVAVDMGTGTIINGPSGATGSLIEGGGQRNAVQISGAATVTNYGSIVGTEYYGDTAVYFGISLNGSGSVVSRISNLGSNSLITNYVAVYAARNVTVTNAGTMAAAIEHGGSANNAVIFGGGTNRLIVDPGAVFIGAVSGGGAVTLTPTFGSTTVLGNGFGVGVTTLELASGASAGALDGLGSTINNFASLVFDSGARWTVAGNDSASGLGTLGISGFAIGDTIDLTGFVAATRTYSAGSLVLTNTGGTRASLAIQGTSFATGDFLLSTDGDGGTDIRLLGDIVYGETIDATGTIANSETVSGGVLTLLESGGSVGTIVVGTSVSTADFFLKPDGATGTDIVEDTIFGTYATGVSLLTNPTTIAATASVTGSVSSYGIYGFSSTNWTVTNLGTVVQTASLSSGISLGGHGTIINTSGTIAGAYTGVLINSTGAVTNQSGASISGITGVNLQGTSGKVVNAGAIYGQTQAVLLDNGGSVTNLSSGTITGGIGVYLANRAATVINTGVIGGNFSTGKGIRFKAGGVLTNNAGGTIRGFEGVDATAASATVINAGGIIGGSTSGFGVYLRFGGAVTNQSGGSISGGTDAVKFAASHVNRMVIDPGATFTGNVDGGNTIGAASISTLELASGASSGTLSSIGTKYVHFANILIDTSAVWSLASGSLIAGYTITDSGTLTNAATIVSTVTMSGAATLTNAAAGTISAAGTGVTGLTLSPVTVVNSGLLRGATAGVSLGKGGAVTNNAGATIAGAQGLYTGIGAGGATVVNAGTISGTAGNGVYVHTGGTVTNLASGLISGSTDSVKFKAGSTGRLVFTPGATFTGTADGGNTIGAASVSTLELASAASAGTLSGLGTKYIRFGNISVDAGAVWSVSSGSLAAGYTVTDSGTLTNAVTIGSAVTMSDGAVLSNASAGRISVATGTAVAGVSGATVSIVNAGGIYGSTAGIGLVLGGSITNQAGGTITGTNAITVAAGVATVVNAGDIGRGTTTGSGIRLSHGGTISNQLGATITGRYGIYITSGTGSISNDGGIDGSLTSGAGIIMQAGSVTNQSSGAVIGYYGIIAFGALTLANAGDISGNGGFTGIGLELEAGGSVTNQTGGTIIGDRGIYVVNAAATVVNQGSIGGNPTASNGICFRAGGLVTNVSGGTISGLHGIYAGTDAATVVNTGAITGNTTTGAGVFFTAGGLVSNQSGGTITGFVGVSITSGTVVNAGDIVGDPTNGIGIRLAGGGTVTNQSSGTISGGAYAVSFASGHPNSLVIAPGARFIGTVDGGNTIGATSISTMELASADGAGTLSGLGSQFIHFAQTTIDTGSNWTLSGTNSLVAGATLSDGGTLTDTGTLIDSGTLTGNRLNLSGGSLTIQTGGSLASSYIYGVAAGGTDTVFNQGTIAGNAVIAIYQIAVGIVTNAAGGLIRGGTGVKLKGTAAALTNLGRIVGTSAGSGGYGVFMRDGAAVTNGQSGSVISTASISGYIGLEMTDDDVVNSMGTLFNYATIVGNGTEVSGIQLTNGGTVFNGRSGATAALLHGGLYGANILQGTVVNYASIIATNTASGYGVDVQQSGGISNLGTRALIEGYAGVKIESNGTLINSGTIESSQGTAGVAVQFTDGVSRLIDDPGAVFIGSIYGGSLGNSVMELAPGTGTIAGFGISITNFTSLVFDPDAQWTVIGNDAANGLGTIGISGFTIGDTIDLTGFAAVSKAFSNGVLVLTDNGGDHASLAIQGTYSLDHFLVTDDGNGGTDITLQAGLVYGETIDVAGTIATSETVNGGTLTLFNGGGTAVGSIAVGTSLSTGDFTVRTKNAGGTDVIVSSVFGTYIYGVTLLTVPATIASAASVSGTATGITGVTGTATTTWDLTNQSFIDETGNGSYAISFAGGATITNASGGAIYGYSYGIEIVGPGAVTNLGRIEYGAHNGGIFLQGGGSVINGAATSGPSPAYISGHYYGIRFSYAGNDTVTNYGTILAPGGKAVLMASGSVVNGSGGATSALISGVFGIRFSGTSGTATNFGTIASNLGTAGEAVYFGAGANRLIVDPGAVFIGSINGGTSATTVMELASGSSAGTLSGFGTSVTNFDSLVFDTGAAWTVSGNASANGLGSLDITGFTFGDTLDLTGFTAVSRTFLSNSLVLTDGVGDHATLAIQSTLTTGDFGIATAGGGTGITEELDLAYGQTIDETGIVVTSETVTSGTMTLFNGVSPVGTLAVGTSLSSGDFMLSSDGAGGTGVIVSSIFGTYSSGVTLLVHRTTITNSARIGGTTANAIGITGPSGPNWILTNLGSIDEIGTNSDGISFAGASSIVTGLAAGDTVINAASGRVIARNYGIAINAHGSVTNQSGGTIEGAVGVFVGAATTVDVGVIVAGGDYGNYNIQLPTVAAITNQSSGVILGTTGVYAAAVATVVNYGSIGAAYGTVGIEFAAGGSVTNQPGGTISGLNGVYGQTSAITVVNAGFITGNSTSGNGVLVAAGGFVSNQTGGVITGKTGIRAFSTAASVINSGSIGGNATSGDGVSLSAASVLTNQSGGGITGLTGVASTTGTVINTGSIGGNATSSNGTGVQLMMGGTLSNQSGGAITGFTGVYAGFAPATVVNAGGIGGNTTGGSGIYLSAGGSFTNLLGGVITGEIGLNSHGVAITAINAGRIDGNPNTHTGAGISAAFGGSITNQAGGTIYGYTGIDADSAVTVVNSGGTISGYRGVYLHAGGTVSNAATGLITAADPGIQIVGGAGTVANGGTIVGSGGMAVNLTAGFTNRVLIDPGASFTGTVDGGNPIGTSAISTLELASGDSAGTMSGLGTKYTNFEQTTIDTGADWTFSGADTLAAGATLTNSGTLTGTGTIVTGGTLTGDPLRLSNGTLTNQSTGILISTYVYGIAAGGLDFVVNQGTITNTLVSAVYFKAGGTVSNAAGALIEGHGGVLIGIGGTVTNAGTIESSQGTSGVAVHFTVGNARLIDDPGAVFVGSIYGGTDGTAVLELAAGDTAGTIAGLGTSVTNFTSLVFDNGAAWTVIGDDAAIGLGTLGITGFATGDTIDLTGFAAVSRTFTSNSLVLTNLGGTHETLAIQGSFATDNFRIMGDGNLDNGTDVIFQTPPVIAAGGTAAFIGGGSPVILDSTLSLIDPTSETLDSGTISIGSGFHSGDVLNFINQNSITGTFTSGSGVLTLNGVASVADYQAALDSISYSFTPSFGDPTGSIGDTSRVIDWLVNDGTATGDIGTSTLDVTHVAPAIIAAGTVSFIGGGIAVALDATLSLSDPDSGDLLNGGTVSIAGFVSGDVLSANTTGLEISYVYDALTGVLTLSGTDTLADYLAVLRSVEYSFNPTDGDPTLGGGDTSRTIDWTIHDDVATSNTGDSTLNVTHAAPSVTVGGTATFNGGGAAVVLDSTIAITGPDSGGRLNGATIAIASGFLAGDVLHFTNQSSIIGTYDMTTGVLTLSGTAPVANYETALASITFGTNPVDGDPSNGGGDPSRAIQWVVSDGNTSNGTSNTGTSILDAVHTAPTITAGATVSFIGGGLAVALDSTVLLADPDSGGALTGATISVVSGFLAGDTLSFSNQNSITGTYDSATGTLILGGSATIANYETALASITYGFTPGDGDPTGGGDGSSRTIDWLVSDGVAASSIAVSTLNVVHAAPAVTAGATVSFIGGGSAVALDSTIVVADPDSGGDLTGAAISVTAGFLSGDTLNFTDQNAIIGSYDSATGTLTLSGVASIGDYETALGSITGGFSPADGDPTNGGDDTTRTIHWLIDDGAASSNVGTSTLNEVHAAPTIAASGTVTFTVGGPEVVLDGGVTVTDPDSGDNLSGGTISVSGGFLVGDTLNFTDQNKITGNYDGATGVLTLSGRATIADYQTALDSITYGSGAIDPASGGDASRTISWSVTDGVAAGTASTTLGIVFSPPAIAGAESGQTSTDAAPISPFADVAISDAVVDQTETVTVTMSDHANGVLSNLGGGGFNSSTGVFTITGADAAVSAAVDGLVFTPAAHQTAPGGSVTTTFTIKVTDSAGTIGDSTTTVGATAVNEPPVITGTVAGQTTSDEDRASPLSGVSIGDVDFGQTETVTVTLSNHANGMLSDPDGGGYDSSTGVYTIAGIGGAVSTALDDLVFTPTAHQVAPGASVTTTFTIHATDTAGGISDNSTTTVGATAANDAPVIAGTIAGQMTTDASSASPLSGVSIGDVDFGQTETVTVTLSNLADGALSNLGGGSYDGSSGVYTISGTDAAVSSAVDGLVFIPTAHQVVPGASVTTTVAIAAIDTAGGTSGDNSTTVIAAAVNDPPAIESTTSDQTTTDEAALPPFTGVSIGDADLGQTETVTVTLSNPPNGALSNLAGGVYNVASGVFTVTGAGAAVSAAIDGLVFTPVAHQVAPGNVVTTTFTIQATDTAGGTSTDTATSVAATAVNDPPEITRTTVNAGVPNQLGDTPFAGVTITDPDDGHTDTVTVTLSNAAGGALSNLGGGSFNQITGVYTISGTPDAVTAALDGLVFTPSPPASGFVANTTFTVAVTGPGGSASNNSISVTSVQQVLNLAATPSADDTISVSTDGTGFAAPTPGQTNQAAVTEPGAGTVYSLPAGYQAEFLGGSANAALSDSTGGSALLVGNTGNDTISASAAGDTILGGSGANMLSASGARDVVNVNGQSTVSASGAGATVSGGTGDPTIMVSGSLSAIGLGSGTSSVTVGGGGSNLYAGTGTANIVDTGTGNAVGGYTGPTSVTLMGAASSVFGGAGPLSVNVASTSSGVAIGTGGGPATITIGGSAASVYGGAGALTVDVIGDGALIGGGVGDGAITIGGANATLYGGTGNLTVDVTGSATSAIIGFDSGPVALTLGGSAARVFGGAGSLDVLDLGMADTIAAGPRNTAVTEEGSGAVVEGGGGGLNFIGGANPATVFGGSGSTTVTGGAGATTLYGSAGGIITFVGVGALTTYQAGSGNETLNAAGAGSGAVLDGGIDAAGGDLLIGGAGNDSLFAGTGADTMTGGGGANEFVFYRSVIAGTAPADMIDDFNAGDALILAGYGTGAAATALSGATSGGGNTTITLSDNTRITFLDVSGVGALQDHVSAT